MTFDEIISISRSPEKLELLIDCYKAAQIGGGVAVRSALPMRQFARLMANITLLERESNERIIYRIAGDNVVNRFDFNPAGMNLLELLSPSMLAKSTAIQEHVFGIPCGHYAVYENEYETGRRLLTESITLPMRKDEKSETVLLLGYHIHHEATGFCSPERKMVLVADLKRTEFIDIGFGEPDAQALLSLSAQETAPA